MCNCLLDKLRWTVLIIVSFHLKQKTKSSTERWESLN